MRTRAPWALAGLLAGLAGLATAYLTATWLGLRGNPVTDVAELVIRLTPGPVAEHLIQLVGRHDKPLLVTGVLIVLMLLFGGLGLLARRAYGVAIAGFVALGVIGLVANQSQFAAPATGILPSLVGVLTWLAVLGRLIVRPAPEAVRRRRRLAPLPAGRIGCRTRQHRGRPARVAGRRSSPGGRRCS